MCQRPCPWPTKCRLFNKLVKNVQDILNLTCTKLSSIASSKSALLPILPSSVSSPILPVALAPNPRITFSSFPFKLTSSVMADSVGCTLKIHGMWRLLPTFTLITMLLVTLTCNWWFFNSSPTNWTSCFFS